MIVKNTLMLMFLVIAFGFGIFKMFISDKKSTSQSIGELKCEDKNKAIVAFREGCGPSTALGFSTHWSLREKWCNCVENNFDVSEYLDKNCTQPQVNTLIKVWNDNAVKVKCGTPKDPI